MSGSVYRAFDAAGRLLYVGSTGDPGKRISAHSSAAKRGQSESGPWFEHTSEVTFEYFATLAQAREVETRAIFDEMPLFNVQGRNPLRSRAIAAALLAQAT